MSIEQQIKQNKQIHWFLTDFNFAFLISWCREIAPAPDQAVLRDIFAKVTSSLPEMDTFGVPSMAYQLLLYLGNAHPKDLLKLFDEYFAGKYTTLSDLALQNFY